MRAGATATDIAPATDLDWYPTDRRGRLGRSARRVGWLGRPVGIYLVSRLVVWLAMVGAESLSGRNLAAELSMWDSRWFLLAARSGWPAELPVQHHHVAQNTVAFVSLFPLVIRAVQAATAMPFLTTGVLVSLATGLTAAIAVWLLARHVAGPKAADRATMMVAFFPGSFVLSMAYAEGMVITFTAVGLLALLQRRWLLAGLLGALATATAPLALAFTVSAAWAAVLAIRHDRQWRALVAPLLTPLGFVAWQLWLWSHTGRLDAWSVTQRSGWDSFLSLRYPYELFRSFLAAPVDATLTTWLLVGGTVLTAVLVVLAWRQHLPSPVFLFGLTVAIGALLAAPIGLRPRFILSAYPLLMGAAMRLNRVAFWLTLGLSAAGLVALTVFSISSYAVFP